MMCRTLLILALVAAAISCADPVPRLREHTYPPSFEYIDRSNLKSAMWQLAVDIQRLDRTLREPASDPAQQQQVVVEILTEVQEAAGSIATPGRVTQHPLLNQNLPRFRELVRRARDDARRTPPNYFSATALSGSCSACHGSAEARL
jgi:hypothetical protein